MQVVTDLWNLHRVSVVHGDIKPGNVLVNGSSGGTGVERPRGVLADFGTAGRIPAGRDKVECL
jgi:serine/threonine protein kinase